MQDRSAVWEWLAYVKARSVYEPAGFSCEAENRLREIVHANALSIEASALKEEVWHLRHRLEKEKSRGTHGRSIDLKYGEGGLQDVYFGIRFLQLRTGLADEGNDRSTEKTLLRLKEADAISDASFEAYDSGYRFLSRLDHEVRLMVGRSHTS